jgi:pilus assembly protein CpaE
MPDKAGRITVVVAEPDDMTASLAESAVASDTLMTVVRKVFDRRALLSTVASVAPDVVVLDTQLDGETAGTVRELLTRAAGCTVIVTGTKDDSTQLSRAVIAGARGFLFKPYRPDELVNAVRDAHATSRNMQEGLKLEHTGRSTVQGGLITVYSPKGGVGTTTIAAYLALSIAAKTKSNVALVDLDLQFGDVGVILDIQSPNSIVDLIGQDQIDQASIDEVMVKHQSGVRVLTAPEQVADAENVDSEKVLRMLNQLRQYFAYVVVDTWSFLEEVTLTALQASDRVVLVTTPEVPALRDLRRVMTEKTQLELEQRGIVVVNRYSPRFGLQIPEIESALGMTVGLALASEGMAITQAINAGTMVTGRIGEAFGQLADLVLKEVGPRHMLMPQLTAIAAS